MSEKTDARSKRYAAAAYWGVVVASVVLGTVYLVAPEFMPYHADAIGRDWSELSHDEQLLFRALLRLAAGGWLATAAALALLLLIPFRTGERWSYWAIPAVSLIFYLPNLYATLLVTYGTPAIAPWYGNAIGIAATLIGAALTLRIGAGAPEARER
ncbi:MAG: hypothetical protein ACNS61_02835 [Candidatus Wenzhouxiangella sp. M2_3B_020]